MMESDTICLGVAIDHRIRRLFGGVQHSTSNISQGSHVSILQAHGHKLGRGNDEIRVTGEMAGPASTGGIAVVLQQPRNDHPFAKGTKAVIKDCETLAALSEIFKVVSCGTLDMQRDISLIDLLPNIPEAEMGRMSEAEMKSAFQTTVSAFCGKEPSVVLCAGKIWLPRPQSNRKEEARDDRKGDAWKLESAGVGRTFDKFPVVILRRENREMVRIHRVNGFHLSYAMNYQPEYSSLRQLLFLSVAQTCGVYRGDWLEEVWMGSLRAACWDLSTSLKNLSPKKYLPDYGKVYSNKLVTLCGTITKISDSVADAGLANSGPAGAYDGLFESKLSEQCNDASLILRQMLKLEQRGWPQSFHKLNSGVLQQAAAETISLTERTWDSQGWYGSKRLREIVRDGLASVDRCVTGTTSKNGKLEIDLAGALVGFLGLAEALEVMLLDLLRLENGEMRATTSHWDAVQVGPLTDLLGGLALS